MTARVRKRGKSKHGGQLYNVAVPLGKRGRTANIVTTESLKCAIAVAGNVNKVLDFVRNQQ